MLNRIAIALFLFTSGQRLNASGLADRVLILVNDNTPPESGTSGLGASVFVGQYYANARSIPQSNILHLSTTTTEGMDYTDYLNQVEAPVRAYLAAGDNKMLRQIVYIVPAYGVPVSFKYAGGAFAVDSVLSAMLMNPSLAYPAYNIYYGGTGSRPPRFDAWSDLMPPANKPFIVTRLDGPSALIAKGLVDKAISAESGLTLQSGAGYFDVQGTRVPSEWQYAVDNEIQAAGAASTAAGFPTVVNVQRYTCGAMIHPAAVALYDPAGKSMGILPPGSTASMSVPVSTFNEGTVTLKVPAGGIAATTPCNILTFTLTTANPSTYVKLTYPIPPFDSYGQTAYLTIQKVVGGATVASNSLLVQSYDAALIGFNTLRFDIRNSTVTVVRDNSTLIALTDPAATPVNYTGVNIADTGAWFSLNGVTVTNLAPATLWTDDFSADSRARYQWSLPGLQGVNALWAWGWYGGATDSYRFVPGAIGAQLTSYTATTIRTPVNPDPAVAGVGSQRWGGAWVPMMLEEGVTATWGAVDEPYANYYPRAGDVLDHFWAGYNFGESFFMAQPGLAWKIVAVGDPLYAPAIFRPAPISLTLSPMNPSMTAGGTVQFSAQVANNLNTAVTWSISPQVGTISAAGLYTAPATVAGMAVVTVRATSVADPTKSVTSTLSLQGSAPVAVRVTAASSALVTGQTQQCTATVTGGSGDTRVTWKLSPATGSISASGMYTAPGAVAGMAVVTVTATSVADPTKSASTTFRILPAVTVSPGSAMLNAGQSQRFVAIVTMAPGLSSILWSIAPQVGTISAAGVYTAPTVITARQTVTVTATSAADPAKSSSITVTLR